jgi:hypothetical protein
MVNSAYDKTVHPVDIEVQELFPGAPGKVMMKLTHP